MKLTRPPLTWTIAVIAVALLQLDGRALAAPLGGIVNIPSQTIGGLGRTAGGLRNDLDTTLRSVQRDIAGRPSVPRTFDRDTNGARVLRRTILALAPTQLDLSIARQLHLDVVRSDNLTSLGFTVVELRTPGDVDLTTALSSLRSADPSGQFDYDHIYDPSGSELSRRSGDAGALHPSVAESDTRVGMIDGGVARRHPAFADAVISTKNVASEGDGPPTPHGTAIASLLVGHDGDFRGYMPGARLYAADVYGGQAGGGGVLEIARALDWLEQNNVPVVNVSLAGPADKLLERVVQQFRARGGVIVAAVGNGGTAAPLTYPAAYPGVVAVTSIDAQHHLQVDAGRGHAMFAALGVEVRAASRDRGYSSFTGTSFAAPLVSARVAPMMSKLDVRAAAAAVESLRQQATPMDFGKYGDGFGYLDPPRTSALSAAQ